MPQIPAITPFTKAELLRELDVIVRECADVVRREPDAHFGASVGGKWSEGQQIDHLIRSAKPLILAFRLPKITLRLLFGKPNRPSRSFHDLAARYQRGLAEGGKSPKAYIPPPKVANSAKSTLLQGYASIHAEFAKCLKAWSEADLDAYLLPHPIIGKITVREMVMFTIYHNYHHLAAIRERLAA